jgi:hypothetical protein
VESITFEPHSQLREIELDALRNCDFLKNVSIPASVERMSWGILPQIAHPRIHLEDGNRYFERGDDFFLDFRRHHLLRYLGAAEELRIPDEIEQIGERCFDDCQTIRFVRFGPMSRLSAIAGWAFYGCKSIGVISIPSTVTSLGQWCFSHCRSLQTVSFCTGSLLNHIPLGAFDCCHLLQSVVFPPSVKTLGPECLSNCPKLVDSPLPINSEVVRIGKLAFACCSSLNSMVIPSSVEYVGSHCFNQCASLHALTFSSPSHLRDLLDLPAGLYGFVSIPDSVEVLSLCPYSPPGSELTLQFGRNSRLAEVMRSQVFCLDGSGSTAFLQVSTRSLKMFRKNLEFERPAAAT